MDDKQYNQKLVKRFNKEFKDYDVIRFYIIDNKQLRLEAGKKDSYIAELEDKIKSLEDTLRIQDTECYTAKQIRKLDNQKTQLFILDGKYKELKRRYSDLKNSLNG